MSLQLHQSRVGYKGGGSCARNGLRSTRQQRRSATRLLPYVNDLPVQKLELEAYRPARQMWNFFRGSFEVAIAGGGGAGFGVVLWRAPMKFAIQVNR